MSKFEQYIKSVRSSGRLYFTIREAALHLNSTINAIIQGLYRLKKKGEIISPAKGLYVIVPPEYQKIGSLPAEELVPIVMKYNKLDYYAGLLTASLYHGSSHQKPQVFQVVTNKQIHPLIFGKVKIEFIYKKDLRELETQKRVVSTGYLMVSSPEVTAMDILIYPNRSGGLNHIATILSELTEELNADKLISLVIHSKETAWTQRLGYILEKIDIQENNVINIIDKLKKYIQDKQPSYIPLASEISPKGSSRNNIWMIIENTKIESDE